MVLFQRLIILAVHFGMLSARGASGGDPLKPSISGMHLWQGHSKTQARDPEKQRVGEIHNGV